MAMRPLRRRRRPDQARRAAPRVCRPLALLDLVRLAREGREAGLEEIVHAGGGERPGQQAPEARREDLGARKRRRGPGADAAAARDELADRLAIVAGRDRVLVALVRLALHERLAQEAGHLIPRERSSGLESGGREHDEIERRLTR